ncbi:MAG: T9SS type A sorting domain-containing protein [Agriterribacter sp.]
MATFNTVSLPDGAVFTLCWTGAAPGGVFSPSSGTTSIGGVPYLNGVTYKLYTGTVSNYTATLDLSALSVLPGTLSSTGYLSDLTNVQNIIASYVTTYMGIEITGKIYIPTATSTYQFRANIFDDQACIKIDGTTVANAATYGSGANLTSGNVNLTAGYHDLLIRFGQVAGPVVWDISWNGGSGTTFTAIPAANLFTTFTGPSAWYAADDNTLQSNADGTDLVASGAFWPDLSANSNNMFGPVSGYNPLYYKTNTAYIRNYNPSVYFSADFMQSPINISGMALGALGKSAVTVAQNAANATYMTYTSFGVNTNTNLFGLAKRATNKISLFTLANDVDETSAFYTSATASTDIIGGTLTNARLATLYANGASRGSATLAAFSTLLYPMYLGVYPGTTLYYTGNMNEVIHYPWALSTTEQQKINSYLSIKWGITLDQTTPTAYLSADGTTTWAADATYKYDITGIGRDDCSALNQLQSTSTDGNDIVTISKGSLAATNNANTSSFSGSKQFIIYGSDNGTITNLNTTNMPTALTSSSLCYKKIGRVWKVQATGSVGSIQMQLGKTGLFIFNKTYYKPKLLISSSATDWTSATIVDLTSLTNGIAQFDNVAFSGTQYFTIALIQAAPGGVVTNLNLWLAADNGPSTTTDNTAVTTWSDLSLQGMNGTGAGSPLYRSGSSTVGINYNPVIGFNGTSQYFSLPSGFADFTAGMSGFSVLNTNFGSTDAYGRFFHAGTGSVTNANAVAWNRNILTDNITVETWSNIAVSNGNMISSNNPLATTNGTTIHGFRMQAGTASQGSRTGNIYFNGLSTLSSSALTVPTNVSRTYNYVGNDVLSELLNGYMPEIVIYNRDLSDAERLRVNSYLAVKYGKTLDVSLTKYTNSQDATIYGYTTHWNRITAIGKDDCSALDQRQSKSQETGALVSISTDVSNGMAASNDLNTVPISTQSAFAVFGDNGRPATWTGVDNLAGALVRLNRIWRMKETGTVGAVYIEVPGNSSALTTKLPAGDLVTDPVYLVVTSAGNFKGTVTLVEMTPDIFGAATKWKCSYDFADGDYFTFATKKLCLGPSGITDGLTTWYRSDNKTTGAIAATSGTLVDETGNNTLTRNASGTATVIAGSATSFNYNRVVTLATNAAFTKGSLSETSIINVNDGSMYGAGTSASSLYMLSNSTTNKAGINAAPVFMAGSGGGFSNSTLPNIYNMNITGGTLSGSQNGTAVTGASVATSLPAAATYSLGIGTYVAGATYNNGSFAEAFSFNRGLTTAEQQVINSYLAIKYGQTISHNYYTPDYDGTNAAAATIYDVSTYANRIFGVGIDSTGCFYQKQSTSQVTGSMLKMTIATSLATENSANTATFTLDRTYVAAGDDNGAVASWVTGTTPAIYNNGSCFVPTRMVRQWKFKAINKQQSVLITIPDNSSAAATKLPALPSGSTKVYMVVNENTDFSVNAAEEELAMTLNATTKEWEVNYTFPNGTYKYITFVTKPDIPGLQPVVVGTGVQDGTATNCSATPYIYYRGTTNSTNAIIAIKPNNNSWSPTSLTVNNQGTLTGGGATFTNTGTGYYQSTNGTLTTRITKRLHTIVAPGSYTLNDGVIVRIFYADADTMAMLTDALPGAATIQRKGWFKIPGSTAASAVAAMNPDGLTGGADITPVAWGTDQGVKYVEFLVNSFSTFGYFAKTTSYALPVTLDYFRGDVASCENVLSWKSGVELNFNYYELQYSNDGTTFETVGIQQAKGSGNIYQMKHIPGNTTTYYRLKMIDLDGTVNYSKIVAVLNNCVKSAITLYPNPVNNYLLVSGLKRGTIITIRDVHGREMIQVKTDLSKERIQIPNMTHGVYFVEVFNSQRGERAIFRIFKE